MPPGNRLIYRLMQCRFLPPVRLGGLPGLEFCQSALGLADLFCPETPESPLAPYGDPRVEPSVPRIQICVSLMLNKLPTFIIHSHLRYTSGIQGNQARAVSRLYLGMEGWQSGRLHRS